MSATQKALKTKEVGPEGQRSGERTDGTEIDVCFYHFHIRDREFVLF